MDIYQHFRKEEHHFIDLVCEWKRLVTEQYAPKLTDFLTPREQQIVRSIVGHHDDVHVAFFGGSSSVERKRALLYPPYMQPNEEDFQLSLFSIRYPKKFVTLGHRDVLGALLSLGVKKHLSAEAVVLGPVASPIARMNDRYRYQCMIKYKRETNLTTALRAIVEHYQRDMARGDVTITIDLNPYMMM